MNLDRRQTYLIAKALHRCISLSAFDPPEQHATSDLAEMRKLLALIQPDAMSIWGQLPLPGAHPGTPTPKGLLS